MLVERANLQDKNNKAKKKKKKNPHALLFIFFQEVGANAILQDIARARENIQKSLAGVSKCYVLQQPKHISWSARMMNCLEFNVQRSLWALSHKSKFHILITNFT